MELRQALQSIRAKVISTFAPYDVIGKEVGALGAKLIWLVEDMGGRFKTIDGFDDQTPLGKAFRAGPGDETHYQRIFEQLGAHDCDLLLRVCQARIGDCHEH